MQSVRIGADRRQHSYYFQRMSVVGLRELRQNASELYGAESGEEITITVAGRPGAPVG